MYNGLPGRRQGGGSGGDASGQAANEDVVDADFEEIPKTSASVRPKQLTRAGPVRNRAGLSLSLA
jgi:hypothetical protein